MISIDSADVVMTVDTGIFVMIVVTILVVFPTGSSFGDAAAF